MTSFIRRHSKIIIFIIPILSILWIFKDVLWPGNFFGNGDIIFNFFEYFNQKATHGPIVSQNILSGFPVMVSVAGVWFYPINAIFYSLFDTFTAYKVLDVTNIILTYVLMYAYVRKLNFNYYYSVFAAFAFTTCGQLMLWSATPTNTNYYFLLPLALLSIEYFFRSQKTTTKIFSFIVLGISLGLGWLSGHIQYIAYINTFAFIYFIFIWIKVGEKKWVKNIATILGAYVISFLVGFAQIAPILLHRVVSARAGGVAVSDFYWGAYYPQDLLHLLLPFFKMPGIPFSNPNLYYGIVPLFLLILAFAYINRIRDSYFTFYTSVFVFCVIFAVRNSPVGLLFHYLPLWNSFRESPRIMFLGSFGAIFMMTYALRYLITEWNNLALTRMRLVVKRLLVYLFLPVSIIFSIIYFFFLTKLENFTKNLFLVHVYPKTAKLPLDHYYALIHSYIHDFIFQFSIVNKDVILIVLGSLFILWFLKFSKKYGEHAQVSFIIIFISIATAVTYFDLHLTLPVQDIATPSKTALYMSKNGGGDFRYMSVLPGYTVFDQNALCKNSFKDSFDLQKELLQPNLNMLYNIDAVDGYDNFMPKDISELLAYVGSEQSVTDNLLANEPITISARLEKMAERKDLLRMMNVKYLVSHFELKDSSFKKVFEEKVGSCGTDIYIYELSNPWPRFFLTDAIRPYTDFDSFATSSLGTPVIVSPTATTTVMGDATPIEPKITYDGLTFDIDLKKATNLYIGNAWLPNYKATVDGMIIGIEKANHGYMYVEVPAGKHEIAIHYHVPIQ